MARSRLLALQLFQKWRGVLFGPVIADTLQNLTAGRRIRNRAIDDSLTWVFTGSVHAPLLTDSLMAASLRKCPGESLLSGDLPAFPMLVDAMPRA